MTEHTPTVLTPICSLCCLIHRLFILPLLSMSSTGYVFLFHISSSFPPFFSRLPRSDQFPQLFWFPLLLWVSSVFSLKSRDSHASSKLSFYFPRVPFSSLCLLHHFVLFAPLPFFYSRCGSPWPAPTPLIFLHLVFFAPFSSFSSPRFALFRYSLPLLYILWSTWTRLASKP